MLFRSCLRRVTDTRTPLPRILPCARSSGVQLRHWARMLQRSRTTRACFPFPRMWSCTISARVRFGTVCLPLATRPVTRRRCAIRYSLDPEVFPPHTGFFFSFSSLRRFITSQRDSPCQPIPPQNNVYSYNVSCRWGDRAIDSKSGASLYLFFFLHPTKL